jgi:hypothetical protein
VVWAAAIVVALSIPKVSVVAGAPPIPQISSGPHASPPTGAKLERLTALYDHEPDIELEGDISAQVTTYTVYTKLAADEEWRSYFGSSAWSWANSAMETADDEMAAQFGINFTEYQRYTWVTFPDTTRAVCNILGELAADADPGAADVLLGYSKNAVSGGAGCAEINGDEAVVMYSSSSYNRWVTSQHEMSHLFAAPDRYPDPNNLHRNDVMENQYTDPDFWCSQDGYEDYVIMYQHRAKFG